MSTKGKRRKSTTKDTKSKKKTKTRKRTKWGRYLKNKIQPYTRKRYFVQIARITRHLPFWFLFFLTIIRKNSEANGLEKRLT